MQAVTVDSQSDHGLIESLRIYNPPVLLFLFVLICVVDAMVAVRKAKKYDSGLGPDKCSFCQQHKGWVANKGYFIGLSVAVLMTYVVDTITYIIHVKVAWSEHWWGGQSMVINLVCSVFFYAMGVMTVLDAKSPPKASFMCWSAAIPIELGILSTLLSRYTSVHCEPVIGDLHGGLIREKITTWELIEVISNSVRLIFLLASALLYACKCIFFKRPHLSETSWLLSSEFGSAGVKSHICVSATVDWWEYLSRYSPFWPLLWPSKSRHLQSVVATCAFLVVLQIGVKLLSHYQLGVVTTALTIQEGTEDISIPWLRVWLFILYRYLPGFLDNLRTVIWTPMSLYTYREISFTGLEHAYSLDFEFHQARKTGELASALNKGKSITELQEQVIFQLLPAIVELEFAIFYFLFAFDAYYALVVGVYSVFFSLITMRMAKWKAESKRDMRKASKEEENTKTELLELWKWVKLCCDEQQHFDRYRDKLEKHLAIQSVTKYRGVVQNFLQDSVLIGLFSFICCIALYQVSIGMRPVGAFVQVIAYVSQLLDPLSFFARLYDSFQTAVINAERMLEILNAEPAVASRRRESPGECFGRIEFKDVTFIRDGRVILDNLTFACGLGTTALVGKSGGGKSTIFDLICGFHDFEGQITIDGYDIKEFDFRQHIAVVSQDTPLFNLPIMYNLTCGTTGATEDEVREACHNAAILEHIDRIPGGYNSLAGPRGTNLSGGEKQRMALARFFLMKLRRIQLVDEGTSALDTMNEQHVEEALMKTGSDHTRMIITHGLKSIIRVDRILVLRNGKIVESGTHGELVKLGGIYAAMWEAERAPYL